jgi:hypothetical protein
MNIIQIYVLVSKTLIIKNMAVYLFGIASVKYGTAATGANMPSGAALTSLPDTVKGSVSIDETEGSTTKFFVDQKFSPVRVVKTEEGELTAVMQFYDMTFANMAALKGGTGNASGYTPATGYTSVDLALELTLDSGHKLQMYNASCITRITGGGGRDKLFALELKATPQMTLDNGGSWKLSAF